MLIVAVVFGLLHVAYYIIRLWKHTEETRH